MQSIPADEASFVGRTMAWPPGGRRGAPRATLALGSGRDLAPRR